MGPQHIDTCVKMTDGARALLGVSAERLKLSGRSFHKVIKIAQTIADLADSENIQKEYVLEALQYRQTR